jgi:NADH-quinone oxidoreductase subunit L
MNIETLTLFTWLIPAAPLLAFFVITLVTTNNRFVSWMVAWLAIFISLGLGWLVAFSVFQVDSEALAHQPVVIQQAIDWLPFGECDLQADGQCANWLKMGVAVDPLTAVLLFMVPFASAMIFVYSVGYHHYGFEPGTERGVLPHVDKEEPLLSRFFAFMSLFAGAMLLLVVADNLLLLFVGWELMGLCSYLLIGFWYARTYDDPQATPPRRAAIKAFLTTRVGDMFMLLGIVFFYRAFGTLNFSEAFAPESLGQLGAGAAAIMTLLLFAGTVGKSAQWPLHTWLPDAMEGPTPVSAVIHAAAMVTAGVYFMIRIFPLVAVAMADNATVSLVVGGIGAFTALMAATIAVAQNDVKRVLAYSTISQLGFMLAALGIGAYVAAAFHLITHAFFKALLFLGSGSIIYGMEVGAEHAHDHHTNPQDMMNMGGLRTRMPITFWTFVIGGLALAGFPFVTAGFWSKDEILADAWYMGTHGNSFALVIFITLAVAALLTAFYTARQISLVFLGEPRTKLAEYAQEANAYMTIPLMALSFFAITLGWVGIPDNFLNSKDVFTNYFHDFVGATVEETLHALHVFEIHTIPFSWIPLAASILVALLGLFLGWWVYGRRPLIAEQPDPLVRSLGPAHTFLKNKWYWDELYQTLFVQPAVFFSEVVVYEWIDRGFIDGTLHLLARSTYAVGHYARRFEEVVISEGVDRVKDWVLASAREFRSIQTGKIQEYALISILIAWALTAVVLLVASGWFDRLSNLFSSLFIFRN